MNRKAGFTDLFLFIIFALIIVVFAVVFSYVGIEVEDELHEKMDDMTIGDANVTEVIDNSIGKVNRSYYALQWITVFLIFGMIIGIFIGSYLVTTKPIFFIPYIFVSIIAVIVGAGISNAYEQIIADETLALQFSYYTASNYILLHLPIILTVVAVVGAVIMFSRLGSRQEAGGLYG